MKCIFFWFVLTCVIGSCQTVRPYQRVYLNDQEMRMGKRSVMSMEENAETYREGSTGGGGSKASGGCGCN